MRRCGEREFHDGFLCWYFLEESYSICELFGDKMKRPLHLNDTWGLRIVHGNESGLVGLEGEGDLNNVI